MRRDTQELIISYFIFVVALTLLLMSAPLWATDKATWVTPKSSNQQTVGGNDSLALGRSSFDVDINQCMGSVAWDTILVGKQKLVLNKWCAAEVYDAKGMHHMAAVMRCDIPEVIKHFSMYPDCIEANTTSIPEPVVIIEEPDEWHEEQLQIQQSYEERIKALEGRLNRPRVVRETVVEQKSLLTPEQAKSLRIEDE